MDHIKEVMSRILSPEKVEELTKQAKKYSELSPKEKAEQAARVSNELEGKLTGYECTKCKNKGYIYRVEERTDSYGKTYYSEIACKCECMRVREELRRIHNSGLSKLLKRYTFKAYEATEDWQQYALKEACAFAKEPEGWFYYGGQPGCGKTHICTAIVGYLLKQGRAAKYMLWQDDITKIKQVINDGEVYEALINSYKTAEILYIDDFFKTRRGDYVSTADVNATFKIINYRYNEELPTIISSELSITDIAEIDEALGSRIAEMADHKIFIERDSHKNYRFRDKKVS